MTPLMMCNSSSAHLSSKNIPHPPSVKKNKPYRTNLKELRTPIVPPYCPNTTGTSAPLRHPQKPKSSSNKTHPHTGKKNGRRKKENNTARSVNETSTPSQKKQDEMESRLREAINAEALMQGRPDLQLSPTTLNHQIDPDMGDDEYDKFEIAINNCKDKQSLKNLLINRINNHLKLNAELDYEINKKTQELKDLQFRYDAVHGYTMRKTLNSASTPAVVGLTLLTAILQAFLFGNMRLLASFCAMGLYEPEEIAKHLIKIWIRLEKTEKSWAKMHRGWETKGFQKIFMNTISKTVRNNWKYKKQLTHCQESLNVRLGYLGEKPENIILNPDRRKWIVDSIFNRISPTVLITDLLETAIDPRKSPFLRRPIHTLDPQKETLHKLFEECYGEPVTESKQEFKKLLEDFHNKKQEAQKLDIQSLETLHTFLKTRNEKKMKIFTKLKAFNKDLKKDIDNIFNSYDIKFNASIEKKSDEDLNKFRDDTGTILENVSPTEERFGNLYAGIVKNPALEPWVRFLTRSSKIHAIPKWLAYSELQKAGEQICEFERSRNQFVQQRMDPGNVNLQHILNIPPSMLLAY